MAAALSDADIEYEIRSVVGEGEEFVNLVESNDPDLLEIRGCDRSSTRKALFRGTAQNILLNVLCPVTYAGRKPVSLSSTIALTDVLPS